MHFFRPGRRRTGESRPQAHALSALFKEGAATIIHTNIY